MEDDEIVSGINVTPLVDVCLVLVIIFMVTAPMFSQPLLKVSLPYAHARKGREEDKVTITLSKDGRLALDEREFASLDELSAALRGKLARSQSKQVVVRADRDATNGRLTDVMAAAKEAGALVLTIATEQAKP
ncbi:MAG: biopolymer transporter ExbD [Elusimicrobia bacterium]|nr:biopolymer transporter ExbD [Elusimicrobiota bacterium]MDE2426056.1 biopolymer transporter ExbD [Elusimicrobiota bacterium]